MKKDTHHLNCKGEEVDLMFALKPKKLKWETPKDWGEEIGELKLATFGLKEKLKDFPEIMEAIAKTIKAQREEGYEKGRLRCLQQHYGKELKAQNLSLLKEIEKDNKPTKFGFNKRLKINNKDNLATIQSKIRRRAWQMGFNEAVQEINQKIATLKKKINL